MSDREWVSTNAGRSAIAALARLTGGRALDARCTRSASSRCREAAAPQFSVSGALATPPAAPPIDVAAAVDADPFAPDRSAPELPLSRAKRGERRIGGEDARPSSRSCSAPPCRMRAHSFATVQLGDDAAILVRVGDKIGDYTVKSIERGHVVFTTPSGKKLDIPELKP